MTPTTATATPAVSPTPPADFALEGWRELVLLTPLSPAAHAWCDEIIPELTWIHCSAIVPVRLIDTVVEGIAQSGLALASYWKH